MLLKSFYKSGGFRCYLCVGMDFGVLKWFLKIHEHTVIINSPTCFWTL